MYDEDTQPEEEAVEAVEAVAETSETSETSETAEAVDEPAEAPAEEAPVAASAPTPEEKAIKAKAEAREQRSRGDIPSRPTKAVAKYLRFSAQKGRLSADLIRGKMVAEAEVILAFSTKASSVEVLKVLKSATANATNNFDMDRDELYVAAAFVDEGPTFKRMKPRARGRADRINKRTSHVTVIVDTAPAELLAGRRGAAAKPASRSARVAASKASTEGKKGPAKKATASKAAAKKPAAKKSTAKKEGDS